MNLPDPTTLDPTDPATFHYWSEDILRYGDMDTMGHINNNALGQFIENARVKLFMDAGEDTAETKRGRGVSWVIRHLELDFIREVQFPGKVDVGIRIVEFGNTSCKVWQSIFQNGDCKVVGTSISVTFAMETRTAVRIPDLYRERMAGYSTGALKRAD